MKALFIIFFMGLSFTAFANNGNNGNNTTPNPTENSTTVTHTDKENKAEKTSKASAVRTEDSTPVKTVSKKGTTRVCTTGTEAPGYGIGSFFVEFVHNSNKKLARMFLDD